MIHFIPGTAFASLSCQASEGRADEFTNNDIRNSFCRVEHSALCAGQVEGTHLHIIVDYLRYTLSVFRYLLWALFLRISDGGVRERGAEGKTIFPANLSM